MAHGLVSNYSRVDLGSNSSLPSNTYLGSIWNSLKIALKILYKDSHKMEPVVSTEDNSSKPHGFEMTKTDYHCRSHPEFFNFPPISSANGQASDPGIKRCSGYLRISHRNNR